MIYKCYLLVARGTEMFINSVPSIDANMIATVDSGVISNAVKAIDPIIFIENIEGLAVFIGGLFSPNKRGLNELDQADFELLDSLDEEAQDKAK